MTDPTADLAKADALLREAKLMLGGSDLADEICAYLATRPEPVDPDVALSREAVAQYYEAAGVSSQRAAILAGDSSYAIITDIALRAIKLAKGERA